MWTLHLFFQFCQIKGKPSLFFSFSFENIWMVWEKPIPLHPLLRTNAVTKQLLSQKGQTKERVLWKDYNKQRSSSTRSRLLFHLILYRVMEKEVLGRTKPINFWRWYRMIFGGILNRDKTNFPSGKVIIKKLYNGEFDPGSGWTLATGLTHASRGAAREWQHFCRRPAHGWVTRMQPALHRGITGRNSD